MKAIFALIGASVLMIVVGVLLILNQPAEPEAPSANGAGEDRRIGVIPAPAETDSEIPTLDVDAKPGSEAWCEQMMELPSSEWSREDSQTFADHCIYE